MADHEQRTDYTQHATPGAPRRPVASTTPREPHRALRRLRGSQRFLPALILVAVVSTFGLAGITYVAARANATTAAQSVALHNAQVLRQLIADQGPGLTVNNGNLVVGADSAVYTLNGDTTLVDRTRSLTGDYATVYQLDGARLVAVATDLPSSGTALGAALDTPAYTALVGNCGAVDSQSCHQSYTGMLTLSSTDYVVGIQPLFDATGAFVGALGAAESLNAVLAPVNQLAVVLVLVGLLLSFVCIVGGTWLIGARSEQVLATIDARLDGVAEAATDLERLAQAQIVRSSARGRAARELNEHTHALDTLAATMDQGQASLRDSAGGIWNEMSQPGALPDLQTTTRWAREAAVVSSRIGTAAQQARDVCRQLITLMNHIVAENNVATDAGREMQFSAHELRRAVEGAEAALGERLITRPHGVAAAPQVRRVRRWSPTRSHDASAALRRPTADAPLPRPRDGQSGQYPAARRPADAPDSLVNESLWIGNNAPGGNNGNPSANPRPSTGQQRTPRRNDLPGQQLRPGGTGEYPAAPRTEHPHDPSARPDAFQWRPPSGQRPPRQPINSKPLSGHPGDPSIWPTFDAGFPNLDSNEHPRRDPGPHWPEE